MTKALIIAPDSDKERIFDHISKINPRTITNDLVISEDIDARSFLKIIMDSSIHLGRYLNRLYFSDHESNNISSINDLDFSNKKIRVVAFPSSLEKHLLDTLDKSIDLEPKNFTHFLSVVHDQGKYYYGLYEGDLFFRKPQQANDLISKAYYKVEEAFYTFNVKPEKSWKVLDIGAAPGGWCQYLSDKVSEIIAVDPGEMQVKKDNVIHVQKKIEEAGLDEKFDLVICDMNKEPRQAAKILLDNLKLMKSGTQVILTLKLIYKGPAGIQYLIDQTKELLSNDFEEIKVEWLLANTKQERTLFAKKKERELEMFGNISKYV